MIVMQYRFTLPADYDMAVIETRIRENGAKLERRELRLAVCNGAIEPPLISGPFKVADQPLAIAGDPQAS
jgi:hypothetical protein